MKKVYLVTVQIEGMVVLKSQSPSKNRYVYYKWKIPYLQIKIIISLMNMKF